MLVHWRGLKLGICLVRKGGLEGCSRGVRFEYCWEGAVALVHLWMFIPGFGWEISFQVVLDPTPRVCGQDCLRIGGDLARRTVIT